MNNDPTINRGPVYPFGQPWSVGSILVPLLIFVYLWTGAVATDRAIRVSEMNCVSSPGWLALVAWPIVWPLALRATNHCEGAVARAVYGPPVLPPLIAPGDTPATIRDRQQYLDGANAEFLCGTARAEDEIRAVARRTILCRDYNAIVGPRMQR